MEQPNSKRPPNVAPTPPRRRQPPWTAREIDALMMRHTSSLAWMDDITEHLNTIFETERTGGQVLWKWLSLVDNASAFKNPAWDEEQEWIIAEGVKMKAVQARKGFTWEGGRVCGWEEVAKGFNERFGKNETAVQVCGRFYAPIALGDEEQRFNLLCAGEDSV